MPPPGKILSFRCSEIDSGAFWDTSARARVHAWLGSITNKKDEVIHKNFILSDYQKQQHRLQQYSLRSSFSAARTSANSGTWQLPAFSHALSVHGAPCCVQLSLRVFTHACNMTIAHAPRVRPRSQTFLSSKSRGSYCSSIVHDTTIYSVAIPIACEHSRKAPAQDSNCSK